MLKLLIISSCTAAKDYLGATKKPSWLEIPKFIEQIQSGCFDEKLKDYAKKPADLYRGKAHIWAKNAFSIFKSKEFNVDWKILSAGYGILDPYNDEIAPYDVSYTNKSLNLIRQMSNQTNVPSKINKCINNSDIIVFALSQDYLNAIQFEKLQNFKNKTFIFIGIPTTYPEIQQICHLFSKQNIKSYFWCVLNQAKHGASSYLGATIKQVANKVNDYEDFIKNYLKDKEIVLE